MKKQRPDTRDAMELAQQFYALRQIRLHLLDVLPWNDEAIEISRQLNLSVRRAYEEMTGEHIPPPPDVTTGEGMRDEQVRNQHEELSATEQRLGDVTLEALDVLMELEDASYTSDTTARLWQSTRDALGALGRLPLIEQLTGNTPPDANKEAGDGVGEKSG